MGTEYNIYKDDNGAELNLDEMSNKLQLEFDTNKIHVTISEQMTSEDIAKIFLKGLTVCSYWMDKDILENMIINHVQENII